MFSSFKLSCNYAILKAASIWHKLLEYLKMQMHILVLYALQDMLLGKGRGGMREQQKKTGGVGKKQRLCVPVEDFN